MNYFKRRNIRQSKLLGANTYTSCFKFDESAQAPQFDDHLINQMPIVQISNVALKLSRKQTTKSTIPEVDYVKELQKLHHSGNSLNQASTQSPINSCEKFQKYKELNFQQVNFFSTQIESVQRKASFRCHSLRRYSLELQNHIEKYNGRKNGVKTQEKKIVGRSLSHSVRLSQNTKVQTTKSCLKKYSQKQLTLGIIKQNSGKTKYGEFSPWRIETDQDIY